MSTIMSTMDAFVIANKFTTKWEAGFVNHPNDPGGATKDGVSLRWLKGLGEEGDIDHDGDIDISDIRALTAETVEYFFRTKFWNEYVLAQLPFLTSIAAYDTFINCGPSQSTKFIQRIANTQAKKADEKLEVDGKLGPLTRMRVSQLCKAQSDMDFDFAQRIVAQRWSFHDELGTRDQFRPFRDGWFNRDMAMSTYLRELRRGGRL